MGTRLRRAESLAEDPSPCLQWAGLLLSGGPPLALCPLPPSAQQSTPLTLHFTAREEAVHGPNLEGRALSCQTYQEGLDMQMSSPCCWHWQGHLPQSSEQSRPLPLAQGAGRPVARGPTVALQLRAGASWGPTRVELTLVGQGLQGWLGLGLACRRPQVAGSMQALAQVWSGVGAAPGNTRRL